MSPTPSVALGAVQTVVRQQRLLPVPGDVLASKGRVVLPDDVVATGERLRWPFAVPVAVLLGEEGRDASAYLLKRPGDEVDEGEVIAAKKGLFGRITESCRSPGAGIVLDFRPQDGLLTIRPKADIIEVRAGLSGKVAAVVPDRGVVIETQAIQCHGLALFGGEAWGPLRAGTNRREDVVVVGPEAAGCVVFGGRADTEAIKRAQNLGVRALVVGSVDVDTWRVLQGAGLVGLSVMVVEAVGDAPLAGRTYQLLGDAVGGRALVTPAADYGQRPLRPQVVVSLQSPTMETVEQATPRPVVGARVRICAGARCGHWGRIAALSLNPTRAVGNIICHTADVVLDDGAPVTVSLANLELVG